MKKIYRRSTIFAWFVDHRYLFVNLCSHSVVYQTNSHFTGTEALPTGYSYNRVVFHFHYIEHARQIYGHSAKSVHLQKACKAESGIYQLLRGLVY